MSGCMICTSVEYESLALEVKGGCSSRDGIYMHNNAMGDHLGKKSLVPTIYPCQLSSEQLIIRSSKELRTATGMKVQA